MLRQERSAPLAQRVGNTLGEPRPAVLPRIATGQVITCTFNLWERLIDFLAHPTGGSNTLAQASKRGIAPDRNG